jgi:glycosyltransferase involved in cell wall biosynthesis
MHLVICTQYYPPEIGAPQNRLSELAKGFVESGHRVTVLTAMPNYPTGTIHKGYGGLLKRETIDGVDVIRTLIFPTHSASFIKRMTNYFSFVISAAFFGTFLLSKPDYLMIESPPLFLAFTGIWLKWAKRTRLIFNVSDLWPESAVSLGLLKRESFAYRLSAWLERTVYKKSWLVSGQSHEIIDDIKKRFPAIQTFHLSNGVDTTRFGADKARDEEKKMIESDEHFVALYSGLHGLAQGLEQIIEVATKLRDNTKIKFVFIGDGAEKKKLIEKTKEQNLNNVLFLDPRPSKEIPHFLAAADVIIVPLKLKIPGAVPSKLYEAMASEKPVLLIADGEAAKIVSDAKAGLTYLPSDIAGVVDGLEQLCNNAELRHSMGANGRNAVKEKFDRNIIVSRFINFLEEKKF